METGGTGCNELAKMCTTSLKKRAGWGWWGDWQVVPKPPVAGAKARSLGREHCYPYRFKRLTAVFICLACCWVHIPSGFWSGKERIQKEERGCFILPLSGTVDIDQCRNCNCLSSGVFAQMLKVSTETKCITQSCKNTGNRAVTLKNKAIIWTHEYKNIYIEMRCRKAYKEKIIYA